METGDLSQWTRGTSELPGQSVDSGACTRPRRGVSDEVAHSGRFSMKLAIDTSRAEASCRQYRYEETMTGRPLFYSAWFYLSNYHEVDDFWNLVQFKSRRFDDVRGVFWVVDLDSRPDGGGMYLRLRWKGDTHGPHSNSRVIARKLYGQSLKDVPVRKWFHVEVYLRQSERFGGRIIVWQDGVRIYDVQNVRTRWPRGDQRMSVNAYSNGVSPPRAILFVDDVVISTTRVYGAQVATAPVPAIRRQPSRDAGEAAAPAPAGAPETAAATPTTARARDGGKPATAAIAAAVLLVLGIALVLSRRARAYGPALAGVAAAAGVTALVVAFALG